MWRLGLGSDSYPERPGAPDCAYYMRTGVCGYGNRCRYNHPRDRASVISSSHSFFFLIIVLKPSILGGHNQMLLSVFSAMWVITGLIESL